MAMPCRVTTLFDTSGDTGTDCLCRWHGIGTRNTLAWVMGTLPESEQRPGTRRLRRIAELRICWVASLPKDLVKVILDHCRGADGWVSDANSWKYSGEYMDVHADSDLDSSQ